MHFRMKRGYALLNHDIDVGFRLGILSLAVCSIACVVAFYLEDDVKEKASQEEKDYFMARSGAFSCAFSLGKWQELCLVQLPLVVGGAFLTFLMFHIVNNVLLVILPSLGIGVHGQTLTLRSKTVAFWRRTKPLRLVFWLCFNVCVTVCIWIAITITSIPEFETFLDEVQEWYDCKIFDYAQALLYGKEAWEEVRKTGGGEECGLFPENKPSVPLQHLRFVAEALLPLTVALSFSVKRAGNAVAVIANSFGGTKTSNKIASFAPNSAFATEYAPTYKTRKSSKISKISSIDSKRAMNTSPSAINTSSSAISTSSSAMNTSSSATNVSQNASSILEDVPPTVFPNTGSKRLKLQPLKQAPVPDLEK